MQLIIPTFDILSCPQCLSDMCVCSSNADTGEDLCPDHFHQHLRPGDVDSDHAGGVHCEEAE